VIASHPGKQGIAKMKWFFAFIVFGWLLCGVIGAAWLGDLDSAHWKKIAKGPLTLIQAFTEEPVSVPTG
jgi:hypothetical protein